MNRKRVLRLVLGVVVFVILIVLSSMVVRPVYVSMTRMLSDLELEYSWLFGNSTGLKISYRSLSPSIFSNINVNGIVISEVSSGKKLIEIRKAVLSYDAKKLFSDNPISAVEVVAVSGLTVEYDAVMNLETTSKLIRLFDDGSDSKFDFESIRIPFLVIIRDISFHYSDNLDDLFVKLKRIELDGSNDYGGGIAFNAAGSASFTTEYLKIGAKRAVSSAAFDLSGTFFPSLNGSSATVQLSNVAGADYTVSRLNALLNYNDSKLQFRTMRTSFPFNLFAEMDFEKNSVHADFSAELFDPLKLIVLRYKNDILSKLNGMVFSGSASLDFDFDTFKTSYNTNVNVSFPSTLIGQKFRLYCNSSGTEKSVRFKKLSAVSQIFDVDYEGTFDIKKLKPFGTLNLNYLILENQSILASEFFLEPSLEGFKCYAPQFFMNSKTLTDVELSVVLKNDSVDFSAAFKDYSHYDEVGTGNLSIDGSFILGTNPYIQARGYASDLFADSLVDIVSVFSPNSVSQRLSDIRGDLSSYIMSSEMYFSSDFDSFTYNIPYGFVANFNKHGELMTFAADGSNKTLQISNLDLQYGAQSVQASISFDFDTGVKDEMSFSTDFTLNSMPYSFYGNISPDWLSVSGAYNFDSMINISDISNNFSGFFQFSNLPLSVGNVVLSLSTMSTFSYSVEEGFTMAVARFEASEISGTIPISPKVSFSGELSNGAFIFNALSYFDEFSELDMGGQIVWNLSDGILADASLELYGQSPISTEKLGLSINIANLNRIPFSVEAFLNDYYLSFSISIDSFPMSRFFSDQGADNILNADISATGTVMSPFISINVSKVSMNLSGYPLEGKASAVLEDDMLSISDMSMDWAFLNLQNFTASLDFEKFSGKASALAFISLVNEVVRVPLEFSINSAVDGNSRMLKLPEFYTVSVMSQGATGALLGKTVPFALNVVHIPGRFEIASNNPDGFKASIVGESFTANTGKNLVFMFDANGSITDGKMDIYVTDLNVDLQKVSSVINIPYVYFDSGRLNGNLRISGLTTDPEFTGFVDVDELVFNVPLVSSYTISTDNIQISAGADGISLPKSVFSCRDSRFIANSEITFNRWSIDNILLNISSIGKKGIPVDMEFPMIHAKGEAFADISLSVMLPDFMSVDGSVVVNNADVEVVTSELQNQISLDALFKMIPEGFRMMTSKKDAQETKDEPLLMDVIADLDLVVGNNVRILFNPFMRGLIAPDTPISLFLDTENGGFAMNGDISLHGGEIAWLNRNFYLKEGRVVLNETQDNFDPRITVRAETREQDENGKRVTIILSALNQPLSQFNPVFSSTPAKSETEIMALLGQVLSADSESFGAFMMAGGDYLVQTTVIRRIENALRELCNFDIFSIRTNVLQNTIKQGLNRSDGSENVAAESDTNNRITFGNFFDNSTVYIGKYFGSAIYVDAMFHWIYDKTKLDDGSAYNGLVFQPEFGFEMASPFVNIRLGVSPDIEAVQQNQWVSSTSITLSWKHSF